MATENPASDFALHIRIAPEETTYWRRPLREGDKIAWLAVLLSVAIGIGAALRLGSPLSGFFLGGGLLAVAYRSWLPQEIQVGPHGVTLRIWGSPFSPRLYRWTGFNRYDYRSGGVLFSAEPSGGPLASLRGLYLPWGEYRDEVAANVEYYLQRWADSSTMHPRG